MWKRLFDEENYKNICHKSNCKVNAWVEFIEME